MENLITELENKVKDCKNTNTIFDTRKYVLLEDAKELLNQAINFTHCCEELCECTEPDDYEDEKLDAIVCRKCNKHL